uniref:thrombospondin type-1 domain-containing protein 4-like isoform X2 n=1 Tax=Myxine glutinosa TaxID=7769 RepID=UPI00358F02E4
MASFDRFFPGSAGRCWHKRCARGRQPLVAAIGILCLLCTWINNCEGSLRNRDQAAVGSSVFQNASVHCPQGRCLTAQHFRQLAPTSSPPARAFHFNLLPRILQGNPPPVITSKTEGDDQLTQTKAFVRLGQAAKWNSWRRAHPRTRRESVSPTKDIPGTWGGWGPWSACTRTCGSGVAEQTRPCLPSHAFYPNPSVPYHLSYLGPSNTAAFSWFATPRRHQGAAPRRISSPTNSWHHRVTQRRFLGAETVRARSKRSSTRGKELQQGQSPPASFSCTGNYRRHRVCNTQACPPNRRDFRAVQCSNYNPKPFMGRYYEWQPFTDAGSNQACELNCKAVGYKFYVRQSARVVDGTPCDPPGNESAPGVCVEGSCERVGCDGYLGSSRNLDHCGVCDGDGSTCRRINGQFQHVQLAPGYHHVADLPAGATDISLRHHTASHSHLVLLDRARRPVLTGDHPGPGSYHVNAAGTEFALSRPIGHPAAQGETIAADGPTTESLALILVHQQGGANVSYAFTLPTSNSVYPGNSNLKSRSTLRTEALSAGRLGLYEPPLLAMETRREDPRSILIKPRQGGDLPISTDTGQDNTWAVPTRIKQGRLQFNWKQIDTTECSASCGSGRRSLLFGCVRRSSHERVAESLCDVTMKPTPSQETCNTQLCPAYWDSGEWSVCSRTCGPGVQLRQVLCRQMFSGRAGTVPPSRCSSHPRPDTSMTCQERICSQWHIRQEWSSCSVPCGRGQRRRHVACVSNQGDVVEDSECNRHLRPRDLENCDLGPCARAWFFTQWSTQCSSTCSEGVHTRSVLCLSGHEGGLPLEACGVQRPVETKPCGPFPCPGLARWFTGLWEQCSKDCGEGVQAREVICVMRSFRVGKAMTVTSPEDCSGEPAPARTQTCILKPCGFAWYMTSWSSCSHTCGGGTWEREVRCLDDAAQPSDGCTAERRPEKQQPCNTQACALRIGPDCVDKFPNCPTVARAQLCLYPYYLSACCASCSLPPRHRQLIHRQPKRHHQS